MRNVKMLILLVLACLVSAVMTGCTTPAVKSEVAMPAGVTSTIGDKVRLFHSGSANIKEVFCVGDVVPVYKEVSAYGVVKRIEVAKIKVLSYEGSQSIIAEVVEGTVKPGNIAEKEATACMVYVPESE
jgi:hypothetical protein